MRSEFVDTTEIAQRFGLSDAHVRRLLRFAYLAPVTAHLDVGDTAAFFFAGHGVAIGGVNCLGGRSIGNTRGLADAKPTNVLHQKVSYSSVKATMASPRLESICLLPPAATTMYCLPPTI
jgi:hypothetical protein